MSSPPQGKGKHLSLIKDELRPAAETRVIAADALTPEQRLACTRALRLAGGGGVLVNALLAEHSWDIRPVILDQGNLFTIRLSDPTLSLYADRFYAFRDLLQHLEATPSALLCALTWGQADGQLWVKRRYFPQTLKDLSNDEGTALHPLQCAQRVISLVYALSQGGIVHGHLHPGNAALNQDRAVVLDAGFYLYTPNLKRDVYGAPEATSGNVTSACDVYGLGVMVRRLLSHRLTDAQAAFADQMCHQDPQQRPGMGEVAEFFRSSSASPAAQKAVRASSSASPAGRMISTQKAFEEVEASEPPPAQTPTEPTIELKQPVGEEQVPPTRTVKTPRAKPPRRNLEPTHKEGGEKASDEVSFSLPKRTLQTAGYILLTLIALVVIYSFSSGRGGSVPYAAQWGSGQPSLMYKVGEEAIAHPTGEAALVITGDALRGQKHPQVNDAVLRMVFRPEWDDSLSREDRELALRLALMGLVPSGSEKLNFTADTHPALALAIAAQVGETVADEQLAQVPVAKLSGLASPFGEMFTGLSQLGVAAMNAPTARALAHLITGDSSEGFIELYFRGSTESAEAAGAALQKKIAILVPLLAQNPEMAEAIFAYAAHDPIFLGRRISWFTAEDSLGLWKGELKGVMLSLVGSVVPAQPLKYEQYADLLSFPGQVVRKEAQARLVQALRRRTERFVGFIATGGHRFSREQVVVLFLGLRRDGEAALPTFFQSKPPAQDVFALLLQAMDAEGMESFNLEAERYLKDKEWIATPEQLKRLTLHRDKLARILAYGRLDPTDAAHLEILKVAAQQEPDMPTRGSLVEKVNSAQEPSAQNNPIVPEVISSNE